MWFFILEKLSSGFFNWNERYVNQCWKSESKRKRKKEKRKFMLVYGFR
jgi:hypothetical protein